jgi:ligand-binding sensor domain-containing protein
VIERARIIGDEKLVTKDRFLPIAIASLMFIAFLPFPGWCARLEVVDHRTQEQGLFDNTVNAVSPAGEASVFIASAGGLHILSDDFFLPVFQNIPAVALSQDPGGDLWAATGTGFIYRIVDRNGLWSASRFAVDKKRKITAITARFGAVTIGTDSGLYYADPDGTLHAILTKTGFSALATAEDGTVIAGARDRTHKKGGLLIIGGAFAARTGWVDELSGRTVEALFIDGDRLLVGTDDGAFELYGTGIHEIGLPGSPGRITAILVYGSTTLVASDTALYVSAEGGPFESVESVESIEPVSEGGIPSGITSLAPGPDRTFWVGTRNDGIYLVRVRP